MDIAQPLLLWEPLPRDIHHQRHDDSDGKPNQQPGIQPTLSKHLLGADRTPQHRRSKVLVDARARVMVFLRRCADARYLRHLPVQDGNGHERRHERRHHLAGKRVPWRDLDVVRHLQVLAEVQRVRTRHVAERFEVVHAERVALVPRAADEFREHVERDLHAGYGVYDAHGNDEEQAQRDAVEDNARGRVRRPAHDGAQ